LSGGNITLNTPVLVCAILDYLGTVPATLDNNNQVDVNAVVVAAGIITLPDVSSQHSTGCENLIDTNTLIANGIARSSQQQGGFTITGAGALPSRPGDTATSPYPTGAVDCTKALRLVTRLAQFWVDVARPWRAGRSDYGT